MMNCREATQLISESLDRELPFRQRTALRWHVFMCKFCARYRRQLRFLREVMRRYSEEVDEERLFPDLTLPAGARERMKHLLHH